MIRDLRWNSSELPRELTGKRPVIRPNGADFDQLEKVTRSVREGGWRQPRPVSPSSLTLGVTKTVPLSVRAQMTSRNTITGRLTQPRSPDFVLVAFVLAFALLPMSDLLAQDHVVLQMEGQSSRMVVPCQIIDYTGEKISVLLKSGANQKTYPAEQVVEVRSSWLDSHERGRKLLAERRVDEAVKSFQDALISEPRIWVRREILASLVRCALRQGDRAIAGTRFLMIVESDRTTRHVGLIPLIWAPESVSSNAKSQARVWITQELDAARLLGASLLLEDTQLAESAQQELAALQRSGDERVRQLAQAQSWRLKLRSLEVSDLELQRWDDRIHQMPTSLRAGPSYLLGRGWTLRREHDRAATALLWLPLMDDTDPRLTARAGYEAAESLRKLGQTEDARRILQEIATHFPDTEFGEAASNAAR